MTVEAQGRHERQGKVSRDDWALTGRRSAGGCCGKKGVAPRGGSAMLLPYGWQLAFTNSRSRELRHCVRPQSFLAVSTPLHSLAQPKGGPLAVIDTVSKAQALGAISGKHP